MMPLLLQILKLADDTTESMNLSINQTLEGHGAEVVKACWNTAYKRLTTADVRGQTIVWLPMGAGMSISRINR